MRIGPAGTECWIIGVDLEFCPERKEKCRKTKILASWSTRRTESVFFSFLESSPPISGGKWLELHWRWRPNLTRRQSGKDVNVTAFRTTSRLKTLPDSINRKLLTDGFYEFAFSFFVLFLFLVWAATLDFLSFTKFYTWVINVHFSVLLAHYCIFF